MKRDEKRIGEKRETFFKLEKNKKWNKKKNKNVNRKSE